MKPSSSEIRSLLAERLRDLERIRRNKENALKRAPEGKLRINNRKSGPQYYCRRTEDERTGVYIPKKEISLAKRLSQKDYDNKCLRAVNREIKAIQKCLSLYPEISAEEVYLSMSLQRRTLLGT